MFPNFFMTLLTENLLGEGISPSDLNDDVVGRTLDAIYKYGATELFNEINFGSSASSKTAIAALSSSTFFWFWNVVSDCRNLIRRDLLAFPLNPESISSDIKKRLVYNMSKMYGVWF